MGDIPYGNIGPDYKIRFTKRLAFEVQVRIRNHGKNCPENVETDDWYEVGKILDGAKSLAGRTSRLTVNLGKHQPEVVNALREALIRVEKSSTHIQIYQSAHLRAEEIADYLNISAIERLGEVGADLKIA